ALVEICEQLGIVGIGAADMMVLRDEFADVARTCGNYIEHIALDVGIHFLRHLPRATANFADNAAAVRYQFAVEQTKQGRLASAIATNDADSLAAFDAQGGPFNQQRAAYGVIEVLQGYQRHD